MILTEVADKVREGYATVVYLDEIEHLLETEEWAHLKISPSAMVPHKIGNFRAILDLSFVSRVFGMTMPSVNEVTIVTAPQQIMHSLGMVLPRLIEAVVTAPKIGGGAWFSRSLAPRTGTGRWRWSRVSTYI